MLATTTYSLAVLKLIEHEQNTCIQKVVKGPLLHMVLTCVSGKPLRWFISCDAQLETVCVLVERESIVTRERKLETESFLVPVECLLISVIKS